MNKWIQFGLEANLPATGSDGKTLYITTDTFKIYWSAGDGETLKPLGVALNWSSITGGPSSTPTELDDAVAKKHEHPNGTADANHNHDDSYDTAGAAASAITTHETTYDHAELHAHANAANIAKIGESGGEPTYNSEQLAKQAAIPTKARGSDIATGTDDAKFATAKALKGSGKVWISANAYMQWNSTDSCIDIKIL